MKILIVNTYYYPNIIGGTENSVKLLAENLAIKNNVAVFTIDNTQTKGIYKEKINNVDIYRSSGGLFNTKSRLNNNANIIRKIVNRLVELKNYYAYNNLNKVINEFKPDIIHTNNLYGISPYIYKLIKRKNIKVVHTLRDYWMIDPSIELQEKDNFIYQRFFIHQTKNINYVTAPSKFTLDAYIKRNYFKNCLHSVVYNAINVNIDNTKNIIKQKGKRINNNIKYIYFGMLEKKKGVDNLLDVFHKINNPNIELLVCGDGSLKNEVLDYAKKDKRIIYCGKLNKEELNNKLLDVDVCIVPSVWDEPFGRVVIEANEFGIPVIGSNKGGIYEILNNIKTGEIFEYNNMDDLREKIIYFSDRNNIKKYFDIIIKNINTYSIENQINEFMKIYENITKM